MEWPEKGINLLLSKWNEYMNTLKNVAVICLSFNLFLLCCGCIWINLEILTETFPQPQTSLT